MIRETQPPLLAFTGAPALTPLLPTVLYSMIIHNFYHINPPDGYSLVSLDQVDAKWNCDAPCLLYGELPKLKTKYLLPSYHLGRCTKVNDNNEHLVVIPSPEKLIKMIVKVCL